MVHNATTPSQALQELATGKWTLVIAAVAMTGLSGALYATLRELSQMSLSTEGKVTVRVLFLVSDVEAHRATAVLEGERLPYVLKPFNFHDFLEKVSDLLIETEAIPAPIRRVRQEGLIAQRRSLRDGRSHAQSGARNTGMFSAREYYDMTEEELTEYERHEALEAELKKKKKDPYSSN